MKQLIVQQPDNPIDYMIKKLSDKERNEPPLPPAP